MGKPLPLDNTEELLIDASSSRARVWTPLLLAVLALSVVYLIHADRAGAASGVTVDASVSAHQTSPASTITSGPISTTNAGDLLVAFIASDGPSGSGGQSFTSVSGGGLTWKLRERTNSQPGTAEIWEAVAPAKLSGVTVTATRSSGTYVGSISVVAFSGADTASDGAVGSGSATKGAPSVSLTTTHAGSWVWGIGNDWDQAKARTLGSGQTLFDQFLAAVGDTYWVQSQTTAGNAANTVVTLNDTAPTTDHYDLSAIEIIPGTPDTQAPSVPTNLKVTAPTSNEVDLSWTASNDNVGVTGYDILRNGTQVATSTTASYQDLTVSPSTSYSYTVEAFDAAGNTSGPSDPANVTTPAGVGQPAGHLERDEQQRHVYVRHDLVDDGHPVELAGFSWERPVLRARDSPRQHPGHESLADDHGAVAEHDVPLRSAVDGQREQHLDVSGQPVHDDAEQHHAARHANQGAHQRHLDRN